VRLAIILLTLLLFIPAKRRFRGRNKHVDVLRNGLAVQLDAFSALGLLLKFPKGATTLFMA